MRQIKLVEGIRVKLDRYKKLGDGVLSEWLSRWGYLYLEGFVVGKVGSNLRWVYIKDCYEERGGELWYRGGVWGGVKGSGFCKRVFKRIKDVEVKVGGKWEVVEEPKGEAVEYRDASGYMGYLLGGEKELDLFYRDWYGGKELKGEIEVCSIGGLRELSKYVHMWYGRGLKVRFVGEVDVEEFARLGYLYEGVVELDCYRSSYSVKTKECYGDGCLCFEWDKRKIRKKVKVEELLGFNEQERRTWKYLGGRNW